MQYLTAATVHQAACGRWIDILQALTSNLAEALKQPGKHVCCPVHGGKDGFRFFKDAQQKGGAVCNTCGVYTDGFSLLMWLNGWSFRQALREVVQFLELQGPSEKTVQPAVPTAKNNSPGDKQRDAQVAGNIERVWRGSLPYTAKEAAPMRRYFESRALCFLHKRIEHSDSLRFHPHLPYYQGLIEQGRFPALVGAIRNTQGQLITLQRIYLNEGGGKATVEYPKKMMPLPSDRRLAGSAIPLGVPEQGILGIAEGLETALAVASVTPYPVWSTVNVCQRSC